MRTSILFLVLLMVGCDSSQTSTPASESRSSIMPTEVSIKLGEIGPDFSERYPDLVQVQHQPAGLDFYKIDWERPRGTVRIDHGRYSLTIDDVLGVSSSQDLKEFKSEGLNEFDVYSGVTEPDLISHDEARLKFFDLLQSIKQKGWKPVVYRDDPRLSGKARFDYMTAVSKYTGLDPNYLPSFDEWMRLESETTWPFYADHVYLDVTFTREPTLIDPNKPGSYLLGFKIMTETEYFRGFAASEDRARWKEVVPAELKRQAAEREKKEAALKATGIKIDESYQDPPVPDFK